MKNLIISHFIFLCFLLAIQKAEAQSVYKCIEQGGAISYQEKPCVKQGETMLDKQGIVDQQTYEKSLRVIDGNLGDKIVKMAAFEWWKAYKKEVNEKFLHFKFTDDSGDTPISLLVDFIVPNSDKVLSEKEIKSRLSQKADYFFKVSVENKLKLKRISLKDGFGYYQTFTDKNLVGKSSYPPGEYLYTTVGLMVLEGVLINFTLLSNDYTAQNHHFAFSFLTSSVDFSSADSDSDQYKKMSSFEKGLAFLEENRIVESVELFRLATIEEPKNVKTWTSYCLALREVNRLQSAFKACDAAYSLTPNDIDLKYRILNLMIKGRVLEEALRFAEALIKESQSKEIIDTINNLGFFAIHENKYDIAEKAFNLLTDRGFISLKLINDQIALAYLKGNKEQAFQLIEQLRKLDENTEQYAFVLKEAITKNASLNPPFYNEEAYTLIPKRLRNVGSGQLINVKTDAWASQIFPLQGVGKLKINMPESWVAVPEIRQQDEFNHVMSLKIYDPLEMTKIMVVDLGKVSGQWTLANTEEQMRTTLKVFFQDRRLKLEKLSEPRKGFEYKETLSKDGSSVRVMHRQELIGLVALGVHVTELNGDAKSEKIINTIFEGIELVASDQTSPLQVKAKSSATTDNQNTNKTVIKSEEDLPEPPEGFSWVSFPMANAFFLKPDGWYENNNSSDDSVVYAISKEPASKTIKFNTGLTLIAIKNLRSKMGMRPIDFALLMAKEIEDSPDNTVIRMDDNSQGPFKSFIIRYENHPANEKPIIIHKILTANEKTGSLFMTLFEAPKTQWEEAWEIGEVILKKYVIDDEF